MQCSGVDNLVLPSEWDDLKDDDMNKRGLGLTTHIVSGHIKQVRYYGYFEKMFEVMKQEMDRKYNDKTMTVVLKRSNTLAEVYALVNKPFWVMTQIRSTKTPEKTLDGTRIFLQAVEAEGFEFTIQSMCLKHRWADYEEELNFLWLAFLQEGSKSQPDKKRLHEIILSMTFYWYTFMPLSRGSAVVGQATMLGLFYAMGETLSDLLPQGMLPDWEAFVVAGPEEYVSAMKPVLELLALAEPAPMIFGEGAVDVDSTFSTLSKMVQAMNYLDV